MATKGGPRKKKGLRVKFCENVASYRNSASDFVKLIDKTVADGFFIQMWYCGRWYSLMDLRFVREKDAVRAARSLTEAGLDTEKKLREADGMTVKQIACEHLQW